MRNEPVKVMGNGIGGGLSVAVAAALAAAFSLLCLLGMAVLLFSTDLSDDAVMPAIRVITVLSVLLAGLAAGRAAKRRGWLHGAAAGGFYLVSLRILGWICFRSGSAGSLASALLIGVLLGAPGGIAGINLPRKARR